MLRLTMLVILLVMLAVPAWGAVYVSNGANPQGITVSLTIGTFTNVYWNSPGSSADLNDQTIVFNNIIQDGSNAGDWYNTSLTGAYGAATKASTDPYATDYYESFDAALFWLQSNTNCTMHLASGGDLTHTTVGTATLPTWYTVALSNNTNCTYNVDCGFIENSVRLADGVIPLDGQGTYANAAGGGYVMQLSNPTYFYPNQWAFPMVDGSGNTTYTASFSPFSEGTILFHARALRAGISDLAGAYTTTLSVNFTEP